MKPIGAQTAQKLSKLLFFPSFIWQKWQNADSAISTRQLYESETMTCTYAQQSTPLLVGPNTIITSLENKDDTQNLFGSPKIEKKWKIYMSWKKLSQKWHILGCRFRTLSTQNRYLDFPDTKTPLPTIFYYHLCSNHRIWSQSAHKRPRNCQNSYFFSNCPCTLRPQKDPKSGHEWVHQIAQYTRTTGPIDYLSIWKVALPPK